MIKFKYHRMLILVGGYFIMTELESHIEGLREKLYLLLLNEEPTDFHVIVCSQELDTLLVQYEQALYGNVAN